MRRSGLVAASLALALVPLAGMLLGERIVGHARSRQSSAGALSEAVGAGSLARSSGPPQVELVGLPALPEAATSEPAGPAPTRVPAVAVGHASAARARVPALLPPKAARASTGTPDPDGPSPRADDLDFGF
jgi:hypothetical protein